MIETVPRVVFDCNVFLQALSNPYGPAGQCVEEAFQRRVLLFIDEALLIELQDVSSRPEVVRKLRILQSRAAELIEDLRKVAVMLQAFPAIFTYPRDPDDAHYVDLAAAANAASIVSRDKDLIDLMHQETEDGRKFQGRFPLLKVVDPPAFLRQLRGL